jgi:(3,5-dihydroxyphenyl)acetyl-CoA 1,2-dioxygenase
MRNPRHLNAEDDTTLAATEVAVDLVLLDPEVEICVLRGGVVHHPRYAGRRILGAGINLTHLYRGLISYLFYVVRDLGYVNKIYRGLSGPEPVPGPREVTTEKLWIAAAETYAIGGACQLLHVVDHVIAERGCRLYLPARKEGIIPGASNLRLPRAVGDRIARQAILSGREFEAGTPDGDLLCDEVVEPGEMDAAIARRVEALTSSGLVNAAANRRALRLGQEPGEVFRTYMALYAREQAFCHFSPALVRNLERHWSAHERTL